MTKMHDTPMLSQRYTLAMHKKYERKAKQARAHGRADRTIKEYERQSKQYLRWYGEALLRDAERIPPH